MYMLCLPKESVDCKRVCYNKIGSDHTLLYLTGKQCRPRPSCMLRLTFEFLWKRKQFVVNIKPPFCVAPPMFFSHSIIQWPIHTPRHEHENGRLDNILHWLIGLLRGSKEIPEFINAMPFNVGVLILLMMVFKRMMSLNMLNSKRNAKICYSYKLTKNKICWIQEM